MIKNKASAYLIFLTVNFFCMQLNAQPVLNIKTTYYDVITHSKDHLVNALNSASPLTNNDRNYYGNTNAEIEWEFLWESSVNNCRLTKVIVTVDITFTLPRLKDASKEVSLIWDKWYPNLVKHENGHKNISLEIASEIENGIIQLPKYRNCNELERKANSLGEEYIDKHNSMQKAYDKNTNHGETEGAWINRYL